MMERLSEKRDELEKQIEELKAEIEADGDDWNEWDGWEGW